MEALPRGGGTRKKERSFEKKDFLNVSVSLTPRQ